MTDVAKRGAASKAGPREKRLKFSLSVAGPVVPMLQRALRAEELGYDCLWMSDHLSDIPPATAIYDGFTVLAYVGARTENMLLASGVTDIQRMHPAKAASVMATLDQLTGGRAILGIGAGEVMNTSPYGMKWETVADRVARLREYVQVVQALWSSSFDKQVGYRGKFYNFKEAHLSLPPFQKPRPPVYIGAFASDALLRLAGELADGWYPGAFFSPAAYRKKAEVIHGAVAKAGRKRGSVEMAVNLPVVFGADNETLSIVRSSFKRGLVINRYMLKLLGEEAAYEMVSKTLQYQLIAPTPAYAKLLEKTISELPISDDSLDNGIGDMMAVGSPEECIEKIARFAKAGAGQIHLSSIVSGESTVETFAKKVMPSFRA